MYENVYCYVCGGLVCQTCGCCQNSSCENCSCSEVKRDEEEEAVK